MRLFAALAALLLLGNSEAVPVTWREQPTQGGLLHGDARSDVAAVMLRAPDGAETPAALDRESGAFLVGLDRDAPRQVTLVAKLDDGREAPFTLTVAPRAWRVERVNTAYHPPNFDARRPPELARIAAARTHDTDERGWLEPLRWPSAGPLRGRFGAQRIYRGMPGSYHAGVDIAAPAGTAVVAPAAGRVMLAADPPFTLEGRLLIIDHGGGLQSALMHLSRIDVTEGQHVAAGQLVGAVGMTGRATGPHLHWGLTWRGARLDPEAAMRP